MKKTVGIKKIDSIAQIEAYVRKMFESIDSEQAKKKASEQISHLETYDWYNTQDIICTFKPCSRIYFQDRANSYIMVGFYFEFHITDECERRFREEGIKEFGSGGGWFVPLVTQKVYLKKFFDTNEDILFYESYGKKRLYNKVLFATEAETNSYIPPRKITAVDLYLHFDKPFAYKPTFRPTI